MPPVRIAPTTAEVLARALARSNQPGPLASMGERLLAASRAGDRRVELTETECVYLARVVEREMLPQASKVTKIVFERVLARLDGHSKPKETCHDTR